MGRSGSVVSAQSKVLQAAEELRPIHHPGLSDDEGGALRFDAGYHDSVVDHLRGERGQGVSGVCVALRCCEAGGGVVPLLIIPELLQPAGGLHRVVSYAAVVPVHIVGVGPGKLELHGQVDQPAEVVLHEDGGVEHGDAPLDLSGGELAIAEIPIDLRQVAHRDPPRARFPIPPAFLRLDEDVAADLDVVAQAPGDLVVLVGHVEEGRVSKMPDVVRFAVARDPTDEREELLGVFVPGLGVVLHQVVDGGVLKRGPVRLFAVLVGGGKGVAPVGEIGRDPVDHRIALHQVVERSVILLVDVLGGDVGDVKVGAPAGGER